MKISSFLKFSVFGVSTILFGRKKAILGTIILTDRGGFIEPLSKELGLNLDNESCLNDGCRTAALLEAEGAKVRCKKIKHEFGQPVNSIEEAAAFMHRQLKLAEEYLPRIEAVAANYVETRKGKLYVPYQRTNCAIIFEK